MRFLALLTLLALKPEPGILHDRPGFDRCVAPETCPGRALTLSNPTKRARVVTVRCAQDPRTDVKVLLKGKRQVVVDLGTGRTLRPGDCYVLKISAP